MGQDFLDIQYIRYVLDPNPGVQIEPEIDPSENRIQIFQKPRTDPAKISGSATLTKRIILSANVYLHRVESVSQWRSEGCQCRTCLRLLAACRGVPTVLVVPTLSNIK